MVQRPCVKIPRFPRILTRHGNKIAIPKLSNLKTIFIGILVLKKKSLPIPSQNEFGRLIQVT